MDTLGESVGRMLEGMGRLAAERQRPAQFVIGQVRSVQPLRVVCPAGELGREDLWINEALLPGWRLGLGAGLAWGGERNGVPVTVQAERLARESSALTEGDWVVLITEDQQDYYLICKAVRP